MVHQTPLIRSWPARLLLAAGLWLSPATARAFAGGISGHSGLGGTSCMSCHSTGGASAPTTTLTGPTTLPPGGIGTYTLTVSGGPGVEAGLDVAVSDSRAQLAATGPGTRMAGTEVTHSAPAQLSSGSASFTFQLTAPLEPGPLTLYGNGLSCDGDGTNSGDAEQQTTLAITVGTGAPAGDGGAPSVGAFPVELLSPGQGDVLQGLVTLQATALSPAGVTSVTFLLNNLPLGSLAAPAYTLSFDSHAWPDGTYSIAASAADRTGAVATSAPATVTIANGGQAAGCSAGGNGGLGLGLCGLGLLRRKRR